MPSSQRPTIGRTVYFVLDQGPNLGQLRPAIITALHPLPGDEQVSPERTRPNEMVSLTVFLARHDVTLLDGDSMLCLQGESNYDENGRVPASWHWPPVAVPVRLPLPVQPLSPRLA